MHTRMLFLKIRLHGIKAEKQLWGDAPPQARFPSGPLCSQTLHFSNFPNLDFSPNRILDLTVLLVSSDSYFFIILFYIKLVGLWLNLNLVENYPEPWVSLPAFSEVLALLANNSRGEKLCWLATLLPLKWCQMQNKMQGQWGPLPPLTTTKTPPKLHDESFLELTKIKIHWSQKINNIKIPRKRGWTVKGKKRRSGPMSVN